MPQFVLIFTLISAFHLQQINAYFCTHDATFGPCLVLDAFPVLQTILANMTSLSQFNTTEADDLANVKEQLSNLTDALCRTAQPIINCLNGQNFSMCQSEVDSNPDAAVAVSIYNSFRMMNFGCSLWLGGAADVESDCPNYEKLYDACIKLAPNVPILKDFGGFFSDSANLVIMNQQQVNASDCQQFKLRTGCIVAQFSKACSSPKSSDLPWWMARYQLDLSKTPATSCEFTSADTASKLAESYKESQSTTPATATHAAGVTSSTTVAMAVQQLAQTNNKSSASSLYAYPAILLLLGLLTVTLQ